MSKKKEYFIKQGYSVQLIEYLEKLGVKTHMFWFLTNLTRLAAVPGQNVYVEEFKILIVLVNKYLELSTKNKFKTFEEAVKFIIREKEKEERLKNNTLHVFSDGHFIVKLTYQDLGDEGKDMSNCIANYANKLKSNECSILALKNKKGETLVHIQVQKNGAISQNYEKANSNVRFKYWKYVYEFLKKNSKNINAENFFDFGWKLHVNKNNYLNLECLLPTSTLNTIGQKGEKVVTICESSIIKKFDYRLPAKFSITSFKKKDIVEKIHELKAQTNAIYDDLLKDLEITDAKNLYLSDDMKEKLFGKEGYFLKGDNYNFQDLLFGLYGENRELQVMEEAARAEPLDEPNEEHEHERERRGNRPIIGLRGFQNQEEGLFDAVVADGLEGEEFEMMDAGEIEGEAAEEPERDVEAPEAPQQLNINPGILVGRLRRG